MFAVAELISCVQNVYTVRTGEEIGEKDAISGLLSWLLEKLKGILESMKQQ